MGLKLHKEAGWIASHAWSFRFLVFAVLFTGAESMLPLFIEHPPLPRRIFALVMFVITSLALVSRVILQRRPPPIFSEPDPAPAPSVDLADPANPASLLSPANPANPASPLHPVNQ